MRLLLVVIIGALFFLLQHLLFRKNWYKGLDVNLDLEKHTVREGDQNTLTEVVRNDKFLPLPVVLLKFSITRTFLFPRETNAAVTDQYYRKEYFSLRPYQSVTRKYHFTASKRGEFNVSSVDVIAKARILRNFGAALCFLGLSGTATTICATTGSYWRTAGGGFRQCLT